MGRRVPFGKRSGCGSTAPLRPDTHRPRELSRSGLRIGRFLSTEPVRCERYSCSRMPGAYYLAKRLGGYEVSNMRHARTGILLTLWSVAAVAADHGPAGMKLEH